MSLSPHETSQSEQQLPDDHFFWTLCTLNNNAIANTYGLRPKEVTDWQIQLVQGRTPDGFNGIQEFIEFIEEKIRGKGRKK